MEQRQQIIIVNWKWTDYKERISADELLGEMGQNGLKEGVNEIIFEKGNYQVHLEDIQKGRGGYFQEHSAEYSEMCPQGKFVKVGIYKDSKHTEQLLYAVLDQYIKVGCDVLLFLHRGHFYKEEDVLALQERYKECRIKCFLMADGRDYIYYATQKSGLLNDKGGFFNGRDKDLKSYIKTFDREKGIVKQPYFDRVWAHYRFEFQSQVFELKEEIFAAWFKLLLPFQPEEIAVVDLKEYLAQQTGRALLYRINSFIGRHKSSQLKGVTLDPEAIQLKKEEKEVVNLEKAERKSFLFDDAIANIGFQDPMEQEYYQEAAQALSVILFDPNYTKTTKFALRNLAEKFNLLVKATPGEFSN